MSTDATTLVVEGYLRDRSGHWLSHEVEFLDVTEPPVRSGRHEAAAAVQRLLGGSLLRAVELDDLVVIAADGHASAEWTLRARHTGSLYGEPPTDLPVTLPMAATFEVADGEIRRVHLFYDSADLRRQLAAGNGRGKAAAP